MNLIDLPAPRAAMLLVFGVLGLVGSAYVFNKVLRALRHGFSIRLQLFCAISSVTFVLMGLFGLLVLDRLQTGAAKLLETEASSLRVLGLLLSDFGPKLSVLAFSLGAGAAVAAYLMGRGLAHPLERLILAAESIARGERHAVLPPPIGREVRRLTDAFESMRRALEDRHTIERFVADLSHELKNPVSAIRAACEVLQEGADEDPAARRRFLGRIDEASHRLEVLLHDLLGLARLEAQGLALERSPVPLAALVRGAVEAVDDALAARGLRVDGEVEDLTVQGSERWLRRAVDNLLSNALRYAPVGSALTISLHRSADEHAVLRVRDAGPGVAPALRARLFDRFVTDRLDADGTGLGLAIVRSVAEHHGGTITLLDADPGTTFELRLPIR
jgi:signal transduction histidine kinase